MNGIVLQGLKRPLLVTQGYAPPAGPSVALPVATIDMALAGSKIAARAGTQIEAALERCRLALGRP